jgi:hypothetical protein
MALARGAVLYITQTGSAARISCARGDSKRRQRRPHTSVLSTSKQRIWGSQMTHGGAYIIRISPVSRISWKIVSHILIFPHQASLVPRQHHPKSRKILTDSLATVSHSRLGTSSTEKQPCQGPASLNSWTCGQQVCSRMSVGHLLPTTTTCSGGFALLWFCAGSDDTFCSNSCIDYLPYGTVRWECFSLQYSGTESGQACHPWMDDEYEFWFRDPHEVAKEILKTCPIEPSPYKEYRIKGNWFYLK